MTLRRLGLATALALTTALPAARPALAQDIELAEIVVSALRTAIDRLRTGVSVSVVDAEDLGRSRETSLAAALAKLPGVSLATSGPFGNTANLRIRGADGRYLAVFVDGIRVSDPSGTTVSFDFGSLSTADVARIEVLRGSQSALWGGSAVGGVINITTRPDMEEGLTQTVQAEAGSYGTAKLSYGLTQKSGGTELAFSATRLHTDGFSAFDGGAEDDGADMTRLSFSARHRISDALAIGGALFWQETRQDYDGYVAFVLADADLSQTRTETGARLFAEVTTGSTEHLFDVTVFDVDRTYYQATTDTYSGRRLTLGWQATTQVSPALSLVYGLDWSREEASYSNLPGGIAATEILGAFGQVLWAPSEKLDISATLRTDRNSGFGSFDTGRLAVAYRPAQGTTLRAAVATGFRAPSIDERFGDYPGFFPFVGNPALQPEESLSYELGIEQSFAGGASLSATLFRLEVDNLITYQFGAPSTLVNLPGASVRKGVEIAAALPVSDALSFGLAYTYTDGRRPNGTRLAQVPLHSLSLSVDAAFGDRLSGGLTLAHVAGRVDNDANTFALVSMPDYTVLNGQVTYDLSDAAEVYLKVDNILNKDYQVVNGYAASGRAVYVGVQARF